MRSRTGSIVRRKPRRKGESTTWWARVTYSDPATGKRHDRQRRAESKVHAKELMHSLLAEIDSTGGRSLANEHMTFHDLATYFETNYLKPAEYIDGRKVAGVRSISPAIAAVKALKEYFGKRRLRGITHSDIRAFRATRLQTPTRGDVARYNQALKSHEKALKLRQKIEQPQLQVTRSITTVNRELEKLRRLFNIAQVEGWIVKNPMHGGDSLFSSADEKKRERIITRDEELLLLQACDHPKRRHLRAIIVCALDTGMRRGEILSLRWTDVDLDNLVVNIRAFNTKTMKERHLSLTSRLALELRRLWQMSPMDTNERVFGFSNNVKRSFTSARRQAGLLDVRFHDLRHTAATRLVGAHLPLAEVGRILGHTQANTTYRYVNANIETARRASAALDAFNAEAGTPRQAPEMVN